MTLLDLTGVSKRFGDVTAVDDVSFSVDRGQVVGFLGPNGAGKSTTMRMITQFFDPDEGRITFDGQSLDEAPVEIKRRVGYLPENNPLYDDMFVSEYLNYIAELRDLGAGTRPAIDDAVEATGLESVFYRPIGDLSKGYRQRVGLAQAILHKPDLLILDEPTEGLDPNQRVGIRSLISQLGQDHTVMLSTHVMSEVQHTCSRLLIIDRGRVSADGSVEELVSRAEGQVSITVEASGSGIEQSLRRLEGVDHLDVLAADGDRVTVILKTRSDRDLRPEVFGLARDGGWTLYELHQDAGSLEDLFRQITTEGEVTQ